jgi:hypothetical protein
MEDWKMVKLVSILSGLMATAVSSIALADIPMGGGGGCSMATSGQLSLAGGMFFVGAAAFLISRRRK